MVVMLYLVGKEYQGGSWGVWKDDPWTKIWTQVFPLCQKHSQNSRWTWFCIGMNSTNLTYCKKTYSTCIYISVVHIVHKWVLLLEILDFTYHDILDFHFANVFSLAHHTPHRIDESSLASWKTWGKDVDLKKTAIFAPCVSKKTALVHLYLMFGFKEKHQKAIWGGCVDMNCAIFPLKILGDFNVARARGFAQCTISEILPSGNSTNTIHLQITHFQQNNNLYMFMLDLPAPC